MNELLLSATAILQIVLINIVLSGDNAVVIAMAAHHLPSEQRRKAMLWGCMFAIGLRLVLTLVVGYVLMIPGVRFGGAMLLAWIACKLLQDATGAEHQAASGGGSLRTAIGRIVLADLVMSLDNVIAIAGVSNSNPWQMVMGLVLSIVTILVFSSTIIQILDRCRWIDYAGTAVLAATAAQMMMHDLNSLACRVTESMHEAGLPGWSFWMAQMLFVAGCLTSSNWWPQSVNREHGVNAMPSPAQS